MKLYFNPRMLVSDVVLSARQLNVLYLSNQGRVTSETACCLSVKPRVVPADRWA